MKEEYRGPGPGSDYRGRDNGSDYRGHTGNGNHSDDDSASLLEGWAADLVRRGARVVQVCNGFAGLRVEVIFNDVTQ